ncbi:MAG: hypothetical protein ACOCPZ_02470 [Natrialbaceae archaeon]
MRRRDALATLAASAAVGLAGCAGEPGESDPTPVDEAFDGEPTRPACTVDSETISVEVGEETREFETASTKPYPEPPESTDEESVADYVTAFEEAYLTHRILCERSDDDHVLSIGFSAERTDAFDRGETAWLVFLRYAGGASRGVDDGALWEADLGYSQALYAVDDTGAARVAFEEPRDPSRAEIRSDAPDPLTDGEFVDRFG